MSTTTAARLGVGLLGLQLHRPPGATDEQWDAVVAAVRGLGHLTETTIVFDSQDAAAVVRCLDGVAQITDEAASYVAARQLEQRQVTELLTSSPQLAEPAEIQAALSQAGFTRTLRDFQVRDVAKLLAVGSGGNFSVPGAGKTTATYALFALLRQQGIVDRMVVVAPWSAHETWHQEADDCFCDGARPLVAGVPKDPIQGADVLLAAYPRLVDGGVVATLRAAVAHRPTLLVFDESHRTKRGLDGAWGHAAAQLAAGATRRLVLSGTPAPNSIEDLQTQMDLVLPGLGDELIGGSLQDAMRHLFVRTTKSELGLPDLEVRRVQVSLHQEHRAEYDELVSRAREQASCGDPSAVRQAVLTVVKAATAMDGCRSAKLDTAERLVAANAAKGRKTLVWASFREHAEALRRRLDPLGAALVYGQTPSDERAKQIARFRDDEGCMVLVATPATLAEGISLHQVCQDQIHVDRTFNAGMFLQSLDRTHRLGMPPDAAGTVTLLSAADTIDTRVGEALDAKISTMAKLLDDRDLHALTGLRLGVDNVDGFSTQELRATLG